MAAFIDSAVLLLIVAGVCSIGAAVIDIDSPSPASQRLVSSHSNSDSSEMFSSSQKRPMETIDDLMNALAQVTKSKDELRCHCNLPVCVTTGYMCKSAMGTCFSEIVDRSDLSRSRHGCLELLSSDHQVCHSSSSHNNGRHAVGHHHLHPQRPLVLCCQDDLCNYGAQQVQLRLDSAVSTHNRNESTSSSSSGVQEPRTVAMDTRSMFENGQVVGSGGNGGHDLWLKAATIAVPIAGGCILVLLVLLAIRMLRRDRENNNDVLTGNNYTVPINRNDFQIRSVWGKSRQIQHEPAYHHVPQQSQQQGSAQWKANCQLSMIQQQQQQQYRQQHQQQHRHHPHQVAPLLHAPHNIVYLPTVQKIIPPKRIMWNKSCILAKNPALQHL